MKELVDEIIRLSKEFGILTEYTAFLACEGTDLDNEAQVQAEATHWFGKRMKVRSGVASVNQEINNGVMTNEAVLSMRNGYFDVDMNRVEVSGVQQISDRAFFKRGSRWIDSRVADK